MPNLRVILCPTDFSLCAAAAVAWAVQLAGVFSARIFLLHALPSVEHLFVGPDAISPVPQIVEAARAQATAELQRIQRQYGERIARIEVREGTTHECILDAAAEADLVVIGTHGRTGLKHVLLGSVAERVVRLSPVPVLTVRNPPSAAPAR
jgi:universal stress protein A